MLQGVSFEVPEGGVTALLGRNGVGKTTTLRAMMGLVPRRGTVALAGEELTRLPTHAIVRRGIGYVPEDRDVFAGLTVDENLRLAERGEKPRYELVYELFPELKVRGAQKAGTLSGGQQQMVAIARALLNDNPRAARRRADEGAGAAARDRGRGGARAGRRADDGAPRRAEPRRRRARRAAGRRARHGQGRALGPAAELLGDPQRVRALLGVHGGSH